MPITLGSNIASLMAQRQLGKTTDSLSTVYERLSSGMRINRASDDAAGLAIASGLAADTRIFHQGVRNLNDGISLFNIADGALNELTNIVVRIQELAEQAANGTYSSKQRGALDTEAQTLSKEFTRIQQSTEFNGLNLLNGETNGVYLQAGVGTNGGIATGIGNYLGTGSFSSAATFSTETGSTSGRS